MLYNVNESTQNSFKNIYDYVNKANLDFVYCGIVTINGVFFIYPDNNLTSETQFTLLNLGITVMATSSVTDLFYSFDIFDCMLNENN